MSGGENNSLTSAEAQTPEEIPAETAETIAEPQRREEPICLTEYEYKFFDWSEFPAYCREKRLSDNDRKLAEDLEKAANIRIRELWNGLSVEASSYVGHIRFDGFDLVVRPKILSLRKSETGKTEAEAEVQKKRTLLTLLTYAFQLSDLRQLGEHTAKEEFFEDLLISLLLQTAGKIVDGGYFQEYNPRRRDLDVMRGRFDQERWIQRGGVPSPSIPCRYYERNYDNILNQTLLAGLRRASSLARFPSLGAQCRSKASDLAAIGVTETSLTRPLLEKAKRKLNRINARYRDAVTIITLLREGSGGFLQGSAISQPLVIPGFFFDMNKLFEAAAARFLRENLPGPFNVEAQKKISPAFEGDLNREMVPDIWIEKWEKTPDGKPILTRYICDTKYKDYDQREITSGDLYQLSVYALAFSEHCGEAADQTQTIRRHAVILYPSGTESNPSQDILSHRVTHLKRYQADSLCGITIRGIDMEKFCDLIRDRESNSDEKRRELALALIEPKKTLS